VLALVLAAHVGIIAAGILLMPGVRARLAVMPVAIVYRMERSRPPEALPPPPRPVLREPAPVSVPVPIVALASEVPVAPPPAPAPTISGPVAPPASIAHDDGPATPPRYDMAYLDNPAPAYPPISRRMKEEGRVVLRVLVSASGSVQDIQVRTSSGYDRLDRAAVEAVRRWRFAPARRGGMAIAAWALVPVRFQLDT
jgi:protein TonB